MHQSKLLLVAVAASMFIACSEAVFSGGLVVGGAALGLLGLKVLGGAAIGGGFLVGAALGRGRGGRRGGYSRRRYGRSVEDVEEIVLKATYDDRDDCAKKLVCVLNAKDTLAEDEKIIATLFGKTGELDLAASSVEFDLAAYIGRKVGAAQCQKIYAVCPYQEEELMNVIRRPDFFNEL